MRFAVVGLVGAALVWLNCFLEGAGADTPAEPKFEMSAAEKALVQLTNKERTEKGLKPLQPNPLLFQAARAHSANMAKHNAMEHVLDGKTPFQRIKATGYRYRYAGENIGWGENVPMTEVMEDWMRSKAHRENILSPRYTQIGVARYEDPKAKGVAWYTQVFAVPEQP